MLNRHIKQTHSKKENAPTPPQSEEQNVDISSSVIRLHFVDEDTLMQMPKDTLH